MTYQVDGRDGIDVNEFIELGSLLKYKIRQHKSRGKNRDLSGHWVADNKTDSETNVRGLGF